jgi:hypothetical protein
MRLVGIFAIINGLFLFDRTTSLIKATLPIRIAGFLASACVVAVGIWLVAKSNRKKI